MRRSKSDNCCGHSSTSTRDHQTDGSLFSCFMLSRIFRPLSYSSVKSASEPTVLTASATLKSSVTPIGPTSPSLSSSLPPSSCTAAQATTPATTTSSNAVTRTSSPRMPSSSVSPKRRHIRRVSALATTPIISIDVRAPTHSSAFDGPTSTARPLRPQSKSPLRPPRNRHIAVASVDADMFLQPCRSSENAVVKLGDFSSVYHGSSQQLYEVDWIDVESRRRILPISPSSTSKSTPPLGSTSSVSSLSRVQQNRHASFLDEVQVIEFNGQDKVRNGPGGGHDRRGTFLYGSLSKLYHRQRRRVRTVPLRMTESLE